MPLRIEINSNDLRSILKSISIVSDEGILSFTNEGIESKLADPANVCLVTAHIPIADFAQYELTEEFEIGLAFLKTLDFITDAKNTQIVLEIKQNKLQIKFDNAEFTQTLLDLSTIRAPPKLPNLDYAVKMDLPTKSLATAIKSCAKISNHITFETVQGVFTLRAIATGEAVSAEIDTAQHIHIGDAISLYSVEYLTDLMKGIGHSDFVMAEMSSNYPLTLHTKLCNTGTLMYLLAPRIESD